MIFLVDISEPIHILNWYFTPLAQADDENKKNIWTGNVRSVGFGRMHTMSQSHLSTALFWCKIPAGWPTSRGMFKLRWRPLFSARPEDHEIQASPLLQSGKPRNPPHPAYGRQQHSHIEDRIRQDYSWSHQPKIRLFDSDEIIFPDLFQKWNCR